MPPRLLPSFVVVVPILMSPSLDETRLIAERIAVSVRGYPGVTSTLLTVGEDVQQTANLGTARVFLSDPIERNAGQFDLMAAVRRDIFPQYPPNVRLKVGEVAPFSVGTSMGNITYAVTARDLDEPSEKSQKIVEVVKKNPAAVDVDSTLILGKPELRVLIDRERAADLGVSVSDVADTLRLFVAGLKASSYAEGGDQYDVQVRAGAQWRVDPETLSMVDVPSTKQGSVPLTSVVTFSKAEGPSVIDRLGRQRQVTIGANAAQGHGESEVNAAIEKAAREAGAAIAPIGRTRESGRAPQAASSSCSVCRSCSCTSCSWRSSNRGCSHSPFPSRCR